MKQALTGIDLADGVCFFNQVAEGVTSSTQDRFSVGAPAVESGLASARMLSSGRLPRIACRLNRARMANRYDSTKTFYRTGCVFADIAPTR